MWPSGGPKPDPPRRVVPVSLSRGTEKWEGARSPGQASRLAERAAPGFLSSSPGAHLGLASQFRGPEGAVSGKGSTLNPTSIANHPGVNPNSALKERSLPRSHIVWSPQLLLPVLTLAPWSLNFVSFNLGGRGGCRAKGIGLDSSWGFSWTPEVPVSPYHRTQAGGGEPGGCSQEFGTFPFAGPAQAWHLREGFVPGLAVGGR